MPIILKISRHSPENCPMINENAKKITSDVNNKLGKLAMKHGVKIVGGWTVHPEHLLVMVYEAASYEAFQKMLMEPEIMKWMTIQDSTEYKMAMTLEESMKLM